METPELLKLLLEDIRQFPPAFNSRDMETTQIIAATYGAQATRLGQRPGYPRLYRCAWKLLALCVGQCDWATLREIFGVMRVLLPGDDQDVEVLDEPHGTQERVSPWHLKAVLYCWAYLRDMRELGQGARYDAALLERRRSREDAEQMLRALQPLSCHLNMTPQEASHRLKEEQPLMEGSLKRPFLFRLSTTLPGLVTLSLLTAHTKHPLDMRVSPFEAQDLLRHPHNLYSQLYESRVDHQQTYDAEKILALFMRLEQQPFRGDPLRLAQRIQDVMPPERPTGVRSLDVVPLLKRAFWSRIVTQQLKPESLLERLGLTHSYVTSYFAIDQQQLRIRMRRCASCPCDGLRESITEPLNGQVYCSTKCYEADFCLCY